MEDKHQLDIWASSEPKGSLLARNSQIILKLAEGKNINLVAEEINICRQTVSKIRHRFIIFGLDGIKKKAPKLGRNSIVTEERSNEILYALLYEKPINSIRWTGLELANKYHLSLSSTYRFLKRRRISLDNPHTIHDTTTYLRRNILDISGLFLCPSVIVVAFWCGDSRTPVSLGSLTSKWTCPMENVPAFFFKEGEKLFKHLRELKKEFDMEKPKTYHCMDFLIFLKILEEKRGSNKDILLISYIPRDAIKKTMDRWSKAHPHVNQIIVMEFGQWIEKIRNYFDSVGEWKKMTISLQIEHLNFHLENWRKGTQRNLGVIATVGPFR